MNARQTVVFEVFADYNQFYVQDGGIFPDAPTDWTDVDVERRAKAAANVLVICPLRNATVPVTLEVFDSAPTIDLAGYDHVIRCSLDLPTGNLQVHECTGGEVYSRAVPPGTYTVLALFSGLNSLSENGLDGEDSYRLVIWASRTPVSLEVLKAWPLSPYRHEQEDC
ncbi:MULTISPECIES: hypothetical protein [unclassified Rhizobacter]|uniref:hypothetical protein n=1 Tax=unclassified Rhizobacter TaxID=2640088 RepID=UPI000A5BA253|nr:MULTISPECIES: hypothetical protein [unclassified Rhizobacter]